MKENSTIGKFVWQDLTIPDAVSLSEFYQKVVGWRTTPHNMGEYNDFEILDSDDNVVAGICHKRGSNASIPSQWLLYVTVENVEASAAECISLGGKILDGPRLMGKQQFCVIEDPAGAVLALIEN